MTHEYLTDHQISELGFRYADMIEEGHSSSDAYSFMKEEIRSGFDHDLWIHVDEDPELDFEDALEEVADAVQAQGEYYIEEREEA